MPDGPNYCTCFIASATEDDDDYCDSPKRRPPNSRVRLCDSVVFIRATKLNPKVPGVVDQKQSTPYRIDHLFDEPYKRSAGPARNSHRALLHGKRGSRTTAGKTRAFRPAAIGRDSSLGTKLHQGVKLTEQGCSCVEVPGARHRGSKSEAKREDSQLRRGTFTGSRHRSDAEDKLGRARRNKTRDAGRKTRAQERHSSWHRRRRRGQRSSAGSDDSSISRSGSLIVLYRGERRLYSSPSCCSAVSARRRRTLPRRPDSIGLRAPAASRPDDKGKGRNKVVRSTALIDDDQRKVTKRRSPSGSTGESAPFRSRHSLIPIGRTKDKKTPRRHRGGGTVDETDLPRRVPQPSIHTRSPAKKPLAPNLELLVQQLCGKSSKLGTGDNPSTTGERSRGLFPFQSTRSGNLKIVPDQVVFESKKLSVLVADPHNATVNVKAEQARVAVPQLELPVSPRADSQRHELTGSEDPFVMDKPLEPTTDVPLSSLGFTSERPIDWKNITLPEKTDLYKEIARRITTYKNADCVVRIGNDEFHCHLLVLQSYSAYFDDKNVKQMDLTGSSVTSRVFSIIYDWMLSPSRESCHLLKRDNILEVFIASQFLGIKELEEQCWAFIDNDELFREDTAFLLYLDARKVGNTAVMELMLPRIMKFFLLLVSTKDFLELAVQELCLLLRSNYISVNSEMEVLMSAVRWLMHDWDTRKQHLLEVMRCVRFGLIAPWQLVDVKRNPENPELLELMSYPEIQKMVDDGLAFVIIKYWYGNQTEDYYHWIDLLGLTEPTNRNWAGEDKHYVTYREFLLYLEEYQRTNIAEFKDKKFGKPVLGGPSKKEDVVAPQVPSARPRMSHTASNLRTLKQHTTDSNAASPCMMMPPEMLSQYLGSIGRNGSKSVSRSTNANRTRTER